MRSIQILTLGILFTTLLLGACLPGGTDTENLQTAEPPSPAASPSPTAAVTAPAAITSQQILQAGDLRTFRILPEASRASYQVQEKFFDRPLPNQAVGTTQDVEGEFQINLGDGLSEVSTRVTVDLATILSDAPPRDGAMREWLATELYPTAVFTSTAAMDLPSSYPKGEEISFRLSGNLSLRGVTRPTVFDVRGHLQGDTVTGNASTVISMKEFHIPADSFFGLSIDDAITIRLDFTAIDTTSSSAETLPAEVPRFSDPTPEAAMIQGIDDRLVSQELIAFISQRDGNDEIYLMNADGSGLSRLTDSPSHESTLRWLADGAFLSFISAESLFEGKLEFHVTGPPSWEPQEISKTIFFEGAPSLSPDGSRLAYIMDGNIYVSPTSGSGSEGVQLTKSPVYDGSPVWSPDGGRIAYMSGNERMNIFIVDVPDTGGEVPEQVDVTGRPSFYGLPAWSPDGRKIAYESGEFNSDIYVSNTTGSEIVQLTDAAGYDGFPVWSPRGDKLLFRSYRDGNSEVYVMNVDGSEAVNLSNHPASDEAPTWSPDGTRIAFASDREGKYQIYVMNADGTNVTRLTEDPAGAGGPVWQPQTR